jgi:putative ABC transport system ATP-binding protein
MMTMNEAPHNITLKNITYKVHQGNQVHTILDAASASWSSGCYASLCGASGSGKSTLLNIIAGLLKPTEGSITFGNYTLHPHDEKGWNVLRARYLGYVFQAPLLIPEFSVLENSMTRGLILGKNNVELRKEAYQLLEELGIAPLAHHKPQHLSGGEQQRVSLARALLGKPAFVIMDEPTAHLDAENRKRFLHIIDTIRQQHSVGCIIATHDASIAHMTHESWNINQGKLEQTR